LLDVCNLDELEVFIMIGGRTTGVDAGPTASANLLLLAAMEYTADPEQQQSSEKSLFFTGRALLLLAEQTS
jgi:hypothetical protein